MFHRQQHEDPVLGQIRADIASLDARLASDVSGLDDGGDPVCRQALLDAGERLQVAGGLKAGATTLGELRVVRRTLIEGLASTRLVREKRGLPLGPDLPPIDEPTPPPPVAGAYQGGYAPAGYGSVGVPTAPAAPLPFWKKALAIGGAVAGGEMLGDMLAGGLEGGEFGGDRDDLAGGGWDGDDGGGGWDS